MNQLLAIHDRLRRADEHLEEVKALLRAYYREQPYNITGEFDPDAAQIRYAFGEVNAPPPVRVATIGGEVLHNLRSALDHLAWELVEENEAGNATKDTAFPVLKAAPAANAQGISPPPHVAGGVSATASALIQRVQPYQLGLDFAADPVYLLRELNNIDKHRHVTIRGVRSEGTYIAGPLPHFTFTARLLTANEWGAEIEFAPDDTSVDVQFRTTFQVVVHEIGPGIVMPLIDALKAARDAVNAIVTEAQRTCFPPPRIEFPANS